MSVEQTEALINGADLPDHPAHTTALKVTEYLTVRDAEDGTTLRRGLHENEIRVLALGQQMALGHLYRYTIRNRKVFHTRKAVIIDVECSEL